MIHWSVWDRDVTYKPGAVVRHLGMLWRAARAVTGAEPGTGGAWVAVDQSEPATVDKATMAEAIDSRIGRGL